MAKLEAIAALEDGWDGPGSSSVTPGALEAYRALVNQVPAVTPDLEPMPTYAGGIRLEWERGDFNYIAELEPTGGMFLCSLGPTDDLDFELETAQTDIGAVVRFYERGVVD